MINLKALKTSINLVSDDYLWFIQAEDHQLVIECIYNKGPYQLKISDTFNAYGSYSPQFLKIEEKMKKIAKVIDQETDKD